MSSSDSDLRVAGFVVRPSSGELESDAEISRLEPRSMQVLLALCEHAGEVVSKQELIRAVWEETFVSDEVLTHAIWDLRRAFGDKASQPHVIQTIPKRGYRLIAPVEQEIGTEDEEPTAAAKEPDSRRGFRIATVALLGLGAMILIAGIRSLRTSHPTQIVETTSAAVNADRLLLVLPSEGPESIAAAIDEGLAHSLEGSRGLRIRQSAICGDDRDAWCLSISVREAAGGWELRPTVEKSTTSEPLWGFPLLRFEGAKDRETALDELPSLVRAAFAVTRMRFFSEPDIQPWISRRYDPRAVHAFLEGVGYVYLHEVGSVDGMNKAMALDPSFIAPFVWRAPSIAGEGGPEEVGSYRSSLERLYAAAEGTPFEKAMIRWAIAMLEHDSASKLRHLRVALRYEPTNRPALLARAAVEWELGEIEEAWSTMKPLVEERWSFPAVYSMAAVCAMMLGNLDDARNSLQTGTDLASVDPTAYALLVALAIYDGDQIAEARNHELLEDRLRQLLPEEPDLVTAGPRQLLADLAESEGRADVANRLRVEL